MSISTPYHDPTVPMVIIERYKLPYLMQFFVQHKQRFKFPRVRLQDLYKLLETSDTRPLSYLIVQILRFFKVPSAAILTVDKALDIFTNEKRTSTRLCIHQVRANRVINELTAGNKAKLLENLIETVYDESPDFNFAPNGFNGGTSSNSTSNHSFSVGNKSLNEIKQEENTDDSMNEIAIKAGCDSRGSSYVYLDDLRLYREKPQSSLSTQWDVVVGPTIEQWHNFIRSLGNADEEGELKTFLQDHLLEVVCTSLDSGELFHENIELNSTYLLNCEQTDFNGSSDYYSINTNKLSNCSHNLYDINDSGGGCSIAADMSCLDPSGDTISIKQEMPDTPESYSGSSIINSNMLSQNPQMIPRSNSYAGLQIPMASPTHVSVASPSLSSHMAPLTPGDNGQMKTSPRLAIYQARDQRNDNSNIQTAYTQPQQSFYHPPLRTNAPQHIPESMTGGQMRYQLPQRFSCHSNGPMMMIGNSSNVSQGGPQVMVFTTQMANDGALEHSRHNTPIYQFHNSHPAVIEFIQQPCNPTRLIGLQKPFENLTQKQLENRKNKMAKLEQIQSSLSKTKAQTPINPCNITQSSSSSLMCDMQSLPLSSNQLLTSAGVSCANMLLSSAGLDSNSTVDNSMQDLSVQTSVMMTAAGSSGLAAQCHPFSNDQQMPSQYHFNASTSLSEMEQQIMMTADSNNPPTSEAALRQWELLRLEYMREKQNHDVMNNMFPSGEFVPYTNSNGINPTMIAGNIPVGSAMMAGHRPNLIRQSFPTQSIPLEPSPGVMYPAVAGVKRPYQLIGAPSPQGYQSYPFYHQHPESMVNQRALMVQQQQQQQPRYSSICDPSWNSIHPNYPNMSHHHPMHQNFSNMYQHHRGQTPAAIGILNGPMHSSQNASSNSSTTTTTPTPTKSKSKKRKAVAKSNSSVNNPSTSTNTPASLSTPSIPSLSNTCLDVKPQLPSSSMCSETQNQRFISPMLPGLGLHDDLNQMNRNMVNFQDHMNNVPMNIRSSPSDSQIHSNPSQLKHELISPRKSSFSPLNDIKHLGLINSSNHFNSSSMNNFSSNSSVTLCSSSISSPSQNLTSASLASLARLSSQMSGGSDSPLFNSLQSQPVMHSSSSSNNQMTTKINNNILHSINNQQVQDQHVVLNQLSQQSNAGHYQSYPSYRHPSAQLPHPQQQQLHNSIIQQHELQNRQLKSNQVAMLNPQSTPENNNFLPNHTSQISHQQHPFQSSQEMMFSPYQSYPNPQSTLNNHNPANNTSNNSTNNNSSIIPGVSVQPGSQQPPSIMVNNTFVNAQLNVQQMNYQHLAAPNVNAQMQIQQQNQAIQPATILNQEISSKHSSEIPAINAPISINQATNNASNDTNNNVNNMNIKTNPSNIPTPSNMGLMNSSVVQIQSKTPHTIQYLPAEPVLTSSVNISVNNNPQQMDLLGGQNKYTSITAPSLELDELISTHNKQMMFQPRSNEVSIGLMGNIHSNNMTMMGQHQIESQQYRFQQQQQHIRLRPAPPATMLPQGTMIMRQSQSQQQQHLLLQQSFSGSNGVMIDQQMMKQQQIQRLKMVNNNSILQQQHQHMIMSGQIPVSGNPHYINMDPGNQEQQHIYHQQHFIALQQQQQQQHIRQQLQGQHFS